MLSYLQSVVLGLIAGMRSMMPLAVLSDYLMRHRPTFNVYLELFGLPQVAKLFKLAAIGELIVDKVPKVPARTMLPGLLSRGLSGVLAGTAVSAAHGKNELIGALLGGTAAVASTFGMYHLRRQTARQFDVPDPVVGGLEDMLAVGSGIGVLALD